jgi:hypothetical protein
MWSVITDMTKIQGHVVTTVVGLGIIELRTPWKKSNEEKQKFVKKMNSLFNK